MTLDELCGEIKNWFVQSRYFGHFTVTGGQINLSDMVADGAIQTGQYFRIIGSVFNDGIYQYPAEDLTDEQFNGAIWALAIPPAVLSLLDEINAYCTAHADTLDSPFQSESFEGYSYNKGSGGSGSGGGGSAADWQNHFALKLDRWRKI